MKIFENNIGNKKYYNQRFDKTLKMATGASPQRSDQTPFWQKLQKLLPSPFQLLEYRWREGRFDKLSACVRVI